jgi:ATP-dependent Lhr-like helicase
VRLSACDPLNLVGIITPGPRVPALRGGEVVFLDGLPVTEDVVATAANNGQGTLPY